ncbi:MAG TPA: DUF4118 domain-containing protein [Acidimicrobiales bacterium]|nr:DUF4118 domain-containing protein [Acidimicrobiales bacterium]
MISYGLTVGLRGILTTASLRQRTPLHRFAAWALAVLAPAVATVALLPARSSIGLAGFLIWALLAVALAAVVGGMRPAVGALVIGFFAALYFYAPPYGNFSADLHPNLVGMLAFLAVGAVVAVLVDEFAGLVSGQSALRQVATLVARAAPPAELFAVVTEVVGRSFGTELTNLVRYELPDAATVVGSWSERGERLPAGSRIALGDNLSGLVARTGRPARREGLLGPSGQLAGTVGSRRRRTGVATPIVVDGALFGAIITLSKPGRRLPRESEARLASFTALVAMAVGNAESRRELAASRARVVAAGDEARRRIERDLHDGAQQRLVSLGLEVRNAEACVPEHLADVRQRLAEVVHGITAVTEELQELSRGIHPVALSRGGLGPALRALARRSPLPVELHVEVDHRLPEPVEVAAYYVVSEALTNATKHGRASLVVVEVGVADLDAGGAALSLSVVDDGSGGADPARGSGLLGLRDRVEALGGTISVESPAGAGTSLTARLPLGAALPIGT